MVKLTYYDAVAKQDVSFDVPLKLWQDIAQRVAERYGNCAIVLPNATTTVYFRKAL